MKTALGSAFLHLLFGHFVIAKSETIDYSLPISPKKYREIIGPGFATKYFSKSTKTPLTEYRDKNVDDIYAAGFRNLRLRCGAELYDYPYNDTKFMVFLDSIETVVNKSLDTGVIPIISWGHNEATNIANSTHLDMFVTWWRKVAQRLKDKDYRLGFNLITELNRGVCKENELNCSGSLKDDINKFTTWMTTVRDEIRSTGGKNGQRIVLVEGPGYTATKGLSKMPAEVMEGDSYMMGEYHIYAGGPVKKSGRQYWVGNGTAEQRETLKEELEAANETGMETYFGAWMPINNKGGGMNQSEAEHFAEYFVTSLKDWSTPWSINDLAMYYDTKESTWRTEIQVRGGVELNMSAILDVIKRHMPQLP